MVAGGTGDFGLHHELFLELETEFFGRIHAELRVIGNVGLSVVAEVVDLLEWAEIFLRCAVAIKTPTHRVWLGLVDDFHLVHVAMAALARNPAIYVRGVVEIYVIRCLVDSHPLDRLAVIARMIDIHRLMQRSQLRAVTLHMLVAVPTSASGRHIGVTRNVDKRVAVAAVEAELIDVDFVGKRNRLGRLIARHQRLGGGIIGKCESYASERRPSADSDFKRQ